MELELKIFLEYFIRISSSTCLSIFRCETFKLLFNRRMKILNINKIFLFSFINQLLRKKKINPIINYIQPSPPFLLFIEQWCLEAVLSITCSQMDLYIQ